MTHDPVVSPEMAERIRSLRSRGLGPGDIAHATGIPKRAVKAILGMAEMSTVRPQPSVDNPTPNLLTDWRPWHPWTRPEPLDGRRWRPRNPHAYDDDEVSEGATNGREIDVPSSVPVEPST